MNKDPILTICIPAYNRPDNLEVLLRSFEKQNSGEIKILVADDCSPDSGPIQKMIAPFLNSMSNLTYIRNEKNLGYSANVINLYERATTRYVWFFCDDDVPLDDSVDKVLSALKKYEPVVAVFNHKQFDPYEKYVEAGVTEVKIYNSVDEFTDYQDLQRTTFLSILVVEKRDSVDLTELKNNDYTNNVYVQMTLTLLLLSDKCRYVLVPDAVLHRNVGYNYGSFFKFYMVDHLRAVNILKTKFNPEKFLWWSIRHLPISYNLYLSQKLGLYAYRSSANSQTLKDIFKYWGVFSIFVYLIPVVSFLVPAILLKAVFFVLLAKDHGYEKAKYLYAKNINRAYNDSRKTGFTAYR